jgi:hypothetical protein
LLIIFNQAFSITITVKLCKFFLAQEVLILLNKAVLIALTQALVAHDDPLPHVLFQLLSLHQVKQGRLTGGPIGPLPWGRGLRKYKDQLRQISGPSSDRIKITCVAVDFTVSSGNIKIVGNIQIS